MDLKKPNVGFNIEVPTIFQHDGFRYVIYPNDHRPPHVHVFKAGAEAVIALGDVDTAPMVRERQGMRTRDVVRAVMVVDERQVMFLRAWEVLHG